jgi:predicted nucleotidyltransferase
MSLNTIKPRPMRPSPSHFPTPHAEVNRVLAGLLPGLHDVLGPELVGVYLSGSLATGDFDRASDVDVVVVTEEEVSDAHFAALDALHQRVAEIDAWTATELECTYISRAALRRFDPGCAVHANLDRGPGERLKRMRYDAGCVVHLHLLRTRGIVLAGPPPETLIDSVSPDDLRQAMRDVLAGWAAELVRDPAEVRSASGYQSYVVLSLCRIRYTLRHGAVVSKRHAAEWAMDAFDPRWRPLIDRALADRQLPRRTPDPQAVEATLAFLQESLEAAEV